MYTTEHMGYYKKSEEHTNCRHETGLKEERRLFRRIILLASEPHEASEFKKLGQSDYTDKFSNLSKSGLNITKS